MTKKKSGDTLNPKEALEKIDKEKSPKLYERTEKLIKAEEVAENQKIRAEKAEAESKKLKTEAEEGTSKKPAGEETPKNDYSLQDIRALSKVHDDDVDRVTKFAKGEETSVAEAMKDKDLQAILKNREEERKTADATNTGGGKRGLSKVSGKKLLTKFKSTEELPDSDEDMEKLVEAELKEKKDSM